MILMLEVGASATCEANKNQQYRLVRAETA